MFTLRSVKVQDVH